jgi:hypothetical protein
MCGAVAENDVLDEILFEYMYGDVGIDSPIYYAFSPLPVRQYWPSLECIWCHIQYLLPRM